MYVRGYIYTAVLLPLLLCNCCSYRKMCADNIHKNINIQAHQILVTLGSTPPSQTSPITTPLHRMVWPQSTPQVLRNPIPNGEDTPKIIEIVAPASTTTHPSVVLTPSSVHLLDHTSRAYIASHERSEESLEKYGLNLRARYNSEDTVLSIQTDKDFLLVYSLLHPELNKNSSDDELLTVYTASGNLLQNGLVQDRAPGFFERSITEQPVPKYQLRFKLFLKITHGILTYLPLDKWEILLVTRHNVQLLNLGDDNAHKILEIEQAETVVEFTKLDRDVLMIRQDGTLSQLKRGPVGEGQQIYSSEQVFEISNVTLCSVNTHFNLLALLVDQGTKLVLFNYRTQTITKETVISDGIAKLQWSHNGNFLLVLFSNKTWSLVSTFGCTTFHSGEHDYDSPWINSITDATILPNSSDIILTDSKGIFIQPLLKQLHLQSQSNYNTQHPILLSGSEVHIYSGHQMPLASTNKSINWNIIKLPFAQFHQLPNIQHASISPDGKFLALANRTSLLIYSFLDHEWSFYINDYNHDLHLNHMTWHDQHNLLIITNRTATHSELVVFDFRKFKATETFDSDCIVFKYDVGSDIQLLNTQGGDMVMYTAQNKYYHFVIHYGLKNGLKIDLVKILNMEMIFKNDEDHLRCLIKIQDKQDPSAQNLLVLNNGELILLRQKQSSYEKLLLFEKVEYFYKINDEEFYLFNGQDILLVKNFTELINTRDPSKSVLSIHPESYPILLTMEKGLFVTIENALSKKKSMELNVITSKNSIFLHDLIRFELKVGDIQQVFKKFKSYKNFQFALELLLYQTVVNEEDLSSVVGLLKINPIYELNVVSKCLRKIEMSYWTRLMNELGTTPQALLTRSIEFHQFKTLGILVIIFINYETEQQGDGSLKLDEDQLINVLKLLYENAHDDDELWETAFELLRFFKMLDPTGGLLKKCEGALTAITTM